jgi:hypothetical protein
VVLLVREELGTERGARDVHEVLAERGLLARGTIVLGIRNECFTGELEGDAPALNDGLRVNTLGDEFLSLSEQLPT